MDPGYRRSWFAGGGNFRIYLDKAGVTTSSLATLGFLLVLLAVFEPSMEGQAKLGPSGLEFTLRRLAAEAEREILTDQTQEISSDRPDGGRAFSVYLTDHAADALEGFPRRKSEALLERLRDDLLSPEVQTAQFDSILPPEYMAARMGDFVMFYRLSAIHSEVPEPQPDQRTPAYVVAAISHVSTK